MQVVFEGLKDQELLMRVGLRQIDLQRWVDFIHHSMGGDNTTVCANCADCGNCEKCSRCSLCSCGPGADVGSFPVESTV